MELETRPLSVGEWLLTLLVQVIPLVGLVVYVYWAFASANIHRKRFCQAWLLLIVVVFGLSVLFLALAGSVGFLSASPA
ncbi:MAG: hypothetical protein EA352_07685 [Gemmatimonadales bacterium]|nr:MAG: hypothetical protein EA352_07685 [Gemmatimonadales bacterium]